MNRKLHNMLFAFTATGLLLLGGLIAAIPVLPEPPADPSLVRVIEAGPLSIRIESNRQAVAAHRQAIEAKARAFEARLEQSADATEVIGDTADFTTDVVVDAVLANAFADAGTGQVEALSQPAHKQRGRSRRAREALALPYFSFAQGLRRSNRS